MSSPDSPAEPVQPVFTAADMKQDARDARLSLRKSQEEMLRKRLENIAKEKCNAEIRGFAECAQQEGLWVVWSCREKSNHSEFSICLSLSLSLSLSDSL
jgi:hypothetical protein